MRLSADYVAFNCSIITENDGIVVCITFRTNNRLSQTTDNMISF